MLPVSDVIPSRTTPAVTISLIVAVAAIFLHEVQLDDRSVRALAERYGVTPAEFWWPTAFTSLFLHSGWLQAATNALYLWLFGGTVESAFGRGRFLVCYLFCGAAGASVHAIIHAPSATPMVGASPAVAAVMGAYLVLYPRSRVLTALIAIRRFDVVEVPAVFFMSTWFVIQLFSEVGSVGADVADGGRTFWAQVAGLVAGMLCGTFVRFGSTYSKKYWN